MFFFFEGRVEPLPDKATFDQSLPIVLFWSLSMEDEISGRRVAETLVRRSADLGITSIKKIV